MYQGNIRFVNKLCAKCDPTKKGSKLFNTHKHTHTYTLMIFLCRNTHKHVINIEQKAFRFLCHSRKIVVQLTHSALISIEKFPGNLICFNEKRLALLTLLHMNEQKLHIIV